MIDPISRISDLKVLVLSLSANGLGDQGVNQCIPYLAKLKNLRELVIDMGMYKIMLNKKLSRNRLSVECAESIFNILANFKDLESLEINLESY